MEVLRKSDRIKECDPDILNDLKDLYGSKNFKSRLKRLHSKKKKSRKTLNNGHLDGVLGLASLIREAETLPSRAATHIFLAKSIQRQLNKYF